MPKLTALRDDGPTKPLTVPTGIEGADLHVDYKPSMLDTGGQLEASALPPREQVGAVLEQLAVAITGWDLEDDAGKVLPVTLATLHALPATVSSALMQAVTEDQRPLAKSPGSFGGG